MKSNVLKADRLSNKGKMTYQTILNILNCFYIPIFIFLSGILFYLCFHHLGVMWVSEWDEARHGVNAYEMYKNKNLIVNTYTYSNDYWNLKPPLSYWGIMIGFKLFGFRVFSLRFYSAFCYFITCVVASLYVRRINKLASLFTMAFFCASSLAFAAHMARAGDADALYTMFFTFAMLAMMSIHRNKKWLYICGLCFALAFLTKSWHAGMIVVIGGLYLLFTGELKKLKPKEWLLFLSSFALPLLLWAFARFLADGTVFFTEMVQKDLLNRTKEGIEGHGFPLAFYFDYIFKGYYQTLKGDYKLISGDNNYIYQIALVLCITGIIFFNELFKKESLKKYLGYLLWFFIPFVAFSLTKTKLVWYVYPTLIPLTMGAGIYAAKLLSSEKILFKIRWVLLLVLAFFLIRHTNLNMKTVQTVKGDDFQSFISSSVSRKDSYAGSNAYLFINKDETPITDWSQDKVFVSEISGDYFCMPGGMKSFLAESNAGVLFVSADLYEQFKDKELSGYTVLQQSSDYYLLQN